MRLLRQIIFVLLFITYNFAVHGMFSCCRCQKPDINPEEAPFIDKPDEHGMSLLHQAVVAGENKRCELLIALGAEVDATDNEGHTPLFHAVVHRNEAILTILLKAGADPDRESKRVFSPLKMAAVGKNSTILALLQEYSREEVISQ